MTNRQAFFALAGVLFLAFGSGIAHSVECTVCERNLVDCRTPAQAKYVTCMNAERSGCSNKCASDCKTQKEAQKCTLDCVRSCQGAGACKTAFNNVTFMCTNDYQACRKNCTFAR
jgi:hypothetical protein